MHYEHSFDAFHAKKDQIYQVVRLGKDRTDRDWRTGVPEPVLQGLRTEYPQLKGVATILGDYNVQLIIPGSGGETVKKLKEPVVFFADPQFFRLFDFPLLSGKADVLAEPNTALLTKATATLFFWRLDSGGRPYDQGLRCEYQSRRHPRRHSRQHRFSAFRGRVLPDSAADHDELGERLGQ